MRSEGARGRELNIFYNPIEKRYHKSKYKFRKLVYVHVTNKLNTHTGIVHSVRLSFTLKGKVDRATVWRQIRPKKLLSHPGKNLKFVLPVRARNHTGGRAIQVHAIRMAKLVGECEPP